jgi:dCTP deaminase
VLTVTDLEALDASGAITAAISLEDGQIQPASMDLRLGPVAYRVRSSFLPLEGNTVRDKLDRYTMHAIDLTKGAVLERHCFYVVPLLESLKLPKGLGGTTNPKSSTGRLDVFTRVIADGATGFDTVPAGYDGPLYAEISPRTLSMRARALPSYACVAAVQPYLKKPCAKPKRRPPWSMALKRVPPSKAIPSPCQLTLKAQIITA